MDDRTKKVYKMMMPKLARTCLSAESALTGKYNVEDVPLGAKLPLIPGNHIVLSTVKLGQKLHRTGCDFDRAYPSDLYITNEYRCLHDPHLRDYFTRTANGMSKLKRKKLITADNKVMCSLKEYNLYRQYLKNLSIQYFNKIYRVKYKKELEASREKRRAEINAKRNDPNNRINRRISCARKVRIGEDKAREITRREVLRMTKEEKEVKLMRKQLEIQERIQEEILREERREKLKKVKLLQADEERQMKDELLYYLHQEEVLRSKELEERKREMATEKQRKLNEKCQRKRRFHLTKMAEMRKIMKEKEQTRQVNVENWKNYFAGKLSQQEKKLKHIVEKDRKEREKINRKVAESLLARSWPGYERTFCDGPGKAGRFSVSNQREILSEQQLKDLGFHDAIATPELMKHVEDQEKGEGDALIESQKIIRRQASSLCSDIITSERASLLVDDILRRASGVVVSSIDGANPVMMSMIKTFERKVVKTGPGVYKALLIDYDDYTIVNAGKQKSNVRFDTSGHDASATENRPLRTQPRPATPKHETSLSKRFGLDDLALEDAEQNSQEVFNQTIRILANKVVDRLHASLDHPEFDKQAVEGRISQLATSVVNEILTLGDGAVERSSSSEEGSLASEYSESDSEHSERSLERRMSWLAHALIKETAKRKEIYNGCTDMSVVIAKKALQSESNVNLLALEVVRSALTSLQCGRDGSDDVNEDHYEELEPLIDQLSSKLVDKVINGERLADVMESVGSEKGFPLEEKISKLALNVVESVLRGSAPLSTSSSSQSVNSFTRDTKVTPIVIDIISSILKLKDYVPSSGELPQVTRCRDEDRPVANGFIDKIFNLQALHEAPRFLLDQLEQHDIERISKEIARNIVPSHATSSDVSMGVSEVARALTENALSASSSGSAASIESAVRQLADSLVNETMLNGVKSNIKKPNGKTANVAVVGENTSEGPPQASKRVECQQTKIDVTLMPSLAPRDNLPERAKQSSPPSATVKDLTDDMARAAIDDVATTTSGDSSFAEDAINVLAAHITKVSSSNESSAPRDLRKALSHAISSIVIDAILARVRHHVEELRADGLDDCEVSKLRRNIVQIVAPVMDQPVSFASEAERKKGVHLSLTQAQLLKISSAVTSNERTTVGVALSVFACDVMSLLLSTLIASAVPPSKTLPANFPRIFDSSRKDAEDGGKTSEAAVIAEVHSDEARDSKNSDVNEVLEQLAEQLVRTVADEKESDAEELKASRSVETLVEFLAFGLVTSLLGLDKSAVEDVTPLQVRAPQDNSKREERLAPETKEAIQPSACSRAKTPCEIPEPPRPLTPLPGMSRRFVEQEKSECEALEAILKLDEHDEKERICEDTAQDHPHRVRSPKPSIACCAKRNARRTTHKGHAKQNKQKNARWISPSFAPCK